MLHPQPQLPPRSTTLPATAPTMVQGSGSRLTPFELGQIKVHADNGLGPTAISDLVHKEDGSKVSKETVRQALRRLEEEPGWRGERREGSGRPRVGTDTLDREIRRALLQWRGEAKCTAAYLRKHIPGAADVSLETLRRRLREAGLAWLRRRRKTLVSAEDKKARLGWARWTLRSRRATLDRWVYGDGTVFYLDRTPSEHDSTRRAALGPHVWRMADGSDALYTDCVGPSSYYKGQGAPVRVWGLLVGPRLCVTILPAGQVMNRWWYAWVVRRFFGAWLADRERPLLVQDYERCLWCAEPLEAMKDIGLTPVEEHPKRSPDLNAIENAWALLRERAAATEPEGLESRADFCRRLHVCVKWVNRHRASSLLEFASNQKTRARDVIAQQGGRTKW